jgi:hypothetical protein
MSDSVFLAPDDLAPDDERRRTAKRRLVAETRRLLEEVALVDASACDEGELDAMTAEVVATADRIAAGPSLRAHGLFSAPGFASALGERSPVSGESNPVAAPLRLWRDGDITRGRATYGPAYEGPPGYLHGGMVAGAFDELLGVAQMASGRAGFTGTLTIKMRAPTPLNQPIEYEAGVDRVSGRKIHTAGRSTCGGKTVGEAEGLFIASWAT